MRSGDTHLVDGADDAAPELGLAKTIAEVQLDLTSDQEDFRQFVMAVIRFDTHLSDGLADVFACGLSLQTHFECVPPCIGDRTLDVYHLDQVGVDFDVDGVVVRAVEAQLHAGDVSHGKTLSV